jgi:hypothetical protein
MKNTGILAQTDMHLALLGLLDEAIAVDGATKGNVQLVQRKTGLLRLEVQRGFSAEFLQLFEFVRSDDFCACGRAFGSKKRVHVPDIFKEKSYAPFVSIAVANGYLAVQSTPILGTDDSVLGIFSTHFSTKHVLSREAKVALDRYASRMSEVIQKNR